MFFKFKKCIDADYQGQQTEYSLSHLSKQFFFLTAESKLSSAARYSAATQLILHERLRFIKSSVSLMQLRFCMSVSLFTELKRYFVF